MFAILCTGPSLTQAVVDSVRGMRVIAVNNAYEMAPWAEALAANDMAWWKHNQTARDFAGRKFTSNVLAGVERVISSNVQTESCSGVLGLEVAKILGATRVLLLGVDFHGSHYFGPYTNGLKNTDEKRRKVHARQFEAWGKANKGIEIYNCTEGSALTCFPMARLETMCELGLRCATTPTIAETLSSAA
jgi:hypothetical protein